MPTPASARGQVAVVDRQLCDECGLCMPLCPPLAITMRREGLLVSAAVCTGWRKCIAPCPVGALAMVDVASLGFPVSPLKVLDERVAAP